MAGTGDADDLFGGDLPAIPRVRPTQSGGDAVRHSRRPRAPSPPASDSDDPGDQPRVARRQRTVSNARAATSSRRSGRLGRSTRTQSSPSDEDEENPDEAPQVQTSSRFSSSRQRPVSSRFSRRRRSIKDDDEDADDHEAQKNAMDEIDSGDEHSGQRKAVGRRGRAFEDRVPRGRGRGGRGGRGRTSASQRASRHGASARRAPAREPTEDSKDSLEEPEEEKSPEMMEDVEANSETENIELAEVDKEQVENGDDTPGEEGDDDDDDDDDDGEASPADELAKNLSKVADNPFEESSDEDLESPSESQPGAKAPSSGTRLTVRQRAMQGENIGKELETLASPRHKKRKPPPDELTKDEALEIKKQQKARLRHMVHEKRNKEKRAAMVDKVLRGVTSKRKKLSLATEAHVAKVGSRLTNNAAREGCARYCTGPNGAFLSIPLDMEIPPVLSGSSRLVAYPPTCERDPTTGKRILPPVADCRAE